MVKYTFSGKCNPCNRPNLRQRSTCELNTILQPDLVLDLFVAALCPSSLFPPKGSAYFAILPLHQVSKLKQFWQNTKKINGSAHKSQNNIAYLQTPSWESLARRKELTEQSLRNTKSFNLGSFKVRDWYNTIYRMLGDTSSLAFATSSLALSLPTSLHQKSSLSYLLFAL